MKEAQGGGFIGNACCAAWAGETAIRRRQCSSSSMAGRLWFHHGCRQRMRSVVSMGTGGRPPKAKRAPRAPCVVNALAFGHLVLRSSRTIEPSCPPTFISQKSQHSKTWHLVHLLLKARAKRPPPAKQWPNSYHPKQYYVRTLARSNP